MSISKKLVVFIFIPSFFLLLLKLDYNGSIWHNNFFAYFYNVKGLDVSNYQGVIDWKKVAATQTYTFVYIKATEGHDFYDDYFLKNWNEAKQNNLLVGAYHFFSTRSSGKEQADFFISHVPKENNSLPPVIDLEIDTTKDPNKIREQLNDLATKLQTYYGKRPILYVTYATYNVYLKGYFKEYGVWIRDVIKPPFLSDRKWLFWQYNNRGKVNGIHTKVDMNVFNGKEDELVNVTMNK